MGALDPTGTLPNLYWVDPDSNIVTAEWDREHAGKPSSYWRSYKLKTKIGWRSGSDALAEIAVCRVGDGASRCSE